MTALSGEYITYARILSVRLGAAKAEFYAEPHAEAHLLKYGASLLAGHDGRSKAVSDRLLLLPKGGVAGVAPIAAVLVLAPIKVAVRDPSRMTRQLDALQSAVSGRFEVILHKAYP